MAGTLMKEERAQARRGAGGLVPLLAGLFFCSGLAGLVYQVLWLRLLALVFGVTVWAAATVLAAFMAGLALGSYAAGKLVDRAQRPLLWYGVAEVLVGASALATPPLLQGLERLYVALSPALPQSLEVLTAIRFGLSSLVLLVPATLMGATLPLILKSSLLERRGLGRRAGLLYATNTAGAVAGTLLAGFVLIGSLGTGFAFGLAAAINVAVGVVAIAAGRRRTPGEGQDTATAERAALPASALVPSAEPAISPAISSAVRRLVLLVFALSGFVSLALEVIWFRVLLQYFDATTYAFTIMLATVLLGIAVGSYLVTPLMRRKLNWLAVLAALELGIGVTSVFSLVGLAYSADVIAALGTVVGRPLTGRFLPVAVSSVLALFPTTLLLGVAFPIGLRLWVEGGQRGSASVGADTGLFYALNVCGGILGSLGAGFALLPAFGGRASLLAMAAVSLLCGLLLCAALRRTHGLALAAAGCALFAGAALAMPDPLASALARRYPGEELLWHEEGVQATVTVQRRPGSGHTLYVNGLHQSDEHPGTVLNHRMIGHLPMLIHPDPKEVLVVGLGSGISPGAISRHAAAHVDVVELSGGVVRASDWFRGVNEDVLRRPNVRLLVDDGRNHLLLTRKRYDVITADIIVPTHAGAGNLYSAQYFRLARSALKEGGMMMQWAGGVPEPHQKLIMRTFLSVFPETTLWFDGHLMLGATGPLDLDRAAFERKVRDPQVREALAAIGIPDFGALRGLYRSGPQELAEYVGTGPLLTDDRPAVEYFLSVSLEEPEP